MLYYLAGNVSTIDYNIIFSGTAIRAFMEKLVKIGIKGRSIVPWIVGLQNFSKFLHDKSVITDRIYNHIFSKIKNYTRRSNITQRAKNVINRRLYTGVVEQSSPFSWIKIIEELITPLINESNTLSTDEKNLFITYIMGLILRLGHRPQVASNFTVHEYKQGKQYNLFFISNVKSQETGMASFKLKSALEINIVSYYYTNIRDNSNAIHDNFILTTTNTPITNPVQFIRRILKKHNIAGMQINSRQYRHIVEQISRKRSMIMKPENDCTKKSTKLMQVPGNIINYKVVSKRQEILTN